MKVCGIDPGSAHVGGAIIDATAPALVLVKAHTWHVGHLEPLAHPVPWMRDGKPQIDPATGAPKMKTHRRVLTATEADDRAREIVAWMAEHGVTHAIVEDVENIAPGETIGSTVGMATEIVRSGKVGQSVLSRARDRGIDVITTSALRARSIAVGRAVKGRGEAAEAMLCETVTGWSEREREGTGEQRRADHERDAGVLAVAGVRILRGEALAKPDPKAKRPRPPRGPRNGPPPRRKLTDDDKAMRKRDRERKAKQAREKVVAAAGISMSAADAAKRTVLDVLRADGGPLATSEIARRIGIGDAAVSEALRALDGHGATSEGVTSWKRWRATEHGAPETVSGNVVGRVQVCAKCGGSRRGHVRGLPCPPRSAAA